MTDQIDRLTAALADRYTIEHELGVGGMATVYLAEDLKHHRKVAVKVLRPELAAALGQDRFLREIEIAANLTHPHILPLHDSGQADGFLFYTMPFVPGESLRDRLVREKQLAVDEAIEITRQVARALGYAHAHNVIHRDIKPENILLAGGEAFVADFGVARAIQAAGGKSLTGTGMSVGTPAYMSPEQAAGNGDLDGRSDIYGLGCVLFELLAGQAPFTGPTVESIVHQHLTADVPAVTVVRHTVPRELADAIQRAMAKTPADRFATAGEFSDALKPRVVTPGGATAISAVRPRSRPIGFVAAAILLVVALVVILIGRPGEPVIVDRSIAVLPFETLGQQEATVFTDGVHGDLLTRLSSVSELSVTSRTSVMGYRSQEKSLPTIARELGVAWILSGEVQETANEVQVSARLVNALTDRQVWAQSYRRELTAANLFEMQSEITAQIARALETQLNPEEERQVARMPTQNLDAYRLYVQGRHLLDQRTEDGMRRAGEYFRQAIDRDSSYSVAWAGLANALWLFEDYGHAEPGSLLPQAGEAARRALALDPDLAEAHAALGMLHYRNREGSDAIRELQVAVDLRASYADAYSWLRWVHSLVGHPNEALEMAKRGVELDPLSVENLNGLSMAYLIYADGARAVDEARRSGEIQPDFTTTHFYEAVALYHLGRMEQAKSILQDLAVPWAGSGPFATLALTHLATGDTVRTREMLDRLREVDEPFEVGLVHAALGEQEMAFEAFRAIDRWEAWPTLAARYLYPEILGPLRDDPRYAQLLRRVDRSWGFGGAAP